ncbi:PTS sugar transporter subunit IIA [Halobacillus sp. A5]|uniref:PTS sugar transporter subunit IIA n=1 Tax=Halobacillus sp. A5 TaxID=2880263 RepID=UPI0020A69D03|nr:PTS sugar transporter subunit IIA [Halobacillus sp. A5]MCP3027972.1 PTS sugar transporter subunit IIA [Halobacillus sp. A5]
MKELFFDESIILLNVAAESKQEILKKMSTNLVEKGLVKPSFIHAILEREEEFATGLPTEGCSVAIPHTDIEHVVHKTISIGILKEPVEFGVMGDDSETTPVKIVFLLAMDEAHSQLSLLQKLMQLFQNQETLKYLYGESSRTNIKNFVKEKLDLSQI